MCCVASSVANADIIHLGKPWNLLGIDAYQVNALQDFVDESIYSEPESNIAVDSLLADGMLVRGPYLQKASHNQITIRWRTTSKRASVVRYGTNPNKLNRVARLPKGARINHVVLIKGLTPDTRYYYSVGGNNDSFASSEDQYFETHPVPGTASPTRIWVLGDSGTANAKAAAVRDAYEEFNGGSHADVWLMLGDNAYNTGTDEEYQRAVFDMYPQTLRNSVLWSTLGNHDGHTADSATQSGPYYNIFNFPDAGQSGGVASGTEAYYSFDYGNIHFVSLDSYETNRSPTGAMANWLRNDLAATTQEWVIAFWHHPAYSKGSHDSDEPGRMTQMRENFLPILEDHGVDLVLAGHSHSYERSRLIDGHYGPSSTFDSSHVVDGGNGRPNGSGAYQKAPGGNRGAVYSVAGSSGKVTKDVGLDHPVMIRNLAELGSMVIDVNGNQLNAVFLNDSGNVRDSFRIVHTDTPVDTVAGTDGAGTDGGGTDGGGTDGGGTDGGGTDGGGTDGGGTDGGTDDQAVVELGRGSLDGSSATAPKWRSVAFDPLATGEHTIRVDWDTAADIRYSLFRISDGVRIATNVAAASPSAWTGYLDASERYRLGVWSTNDVADFRATIQTGAAP